MGTIENRWRSAEIWEPSELILELMLAHFGIQKWVWKPKGWKKWNLQLPPVKPIHREGPRVQRRAKMSSGAAPEPIFFASSVWIEIWLILTYKMTSKMQWGMWGWVCAVGDGGMRKTSWGLYATVIFLYILSAYIGQLPDGACRRLPESWECRNRIQRG